ncbi:MULTISPECIES: ATP-binding cassette domain-containing protein [Brenneria]|uniref:ABC-type dipeptide transporter n=1 Tax=Brenneria nigrifluens DSM 30175 = ATCC 13028 TaxID=1121120 RepID=A0A2U1UVG7_9GAMM|nr:MULTISPECIES: ABC transporter ATP-binding protein [Brenneria]EHD20244.1 Nickel-transporting ATPase [Brenneria sp. EniD312]PWC25669.1 ABC transporter ATP-binding protein [Brenneria nigrifluens DSM 30175 = ATCC 13028]QCR03466.1 ABC transporter ATP-binding protein [Brenneria nigrifluens DSM 30175 = ATCC 13028]
MNPLLRVDALSLRSGRQTLVSDLSFTIAPGERVGLIGESGSGKSLTALAVIGLLPAGIQAQGSVVLADRQVIGAGDRQLTRLRGDGVAMVFQEPLTALDPLMKIGRQLAEPLRRRALRDGRAADRRTVEREVLSWLERVALSPPRRIAAAWPHELSGGQRQRVAIAMALACRPALLIADEPTTALDVTTQADILALLTDLVREQGSALLFISHDLPVVAKVADGVMVMNNGHLVEQGDLATIFSQPKNSYTQMLVATANAFDKILGGPS